MKRLKVYNWHGFRDECEGPHRQTREICAAPSMAAVARIVGVNSPRKLYNLSVTGNAVSIDKAMSEPGVVFWRPIGDYAGEWRRG